MIIFTNTQLEQTVSHNSTTTANVSAPLVTINVYPVMSLYSSQYEIVNI